MGITKRLSYFDYCLLKLRGYAADVKINFGICIGSKKEQNDMFRRYYKVDR